MRITGCFIIAFFITSSSLFSQKSNNLFLGQNPPSDTAKRLNIGSFFEDETNYKKSFNLAFSRDGKEVFFSYIKRTEEKPEPAYEIRNFNYVDGEWTWPKTASFSGIFSDVDINFTPDGKYIFFATDRPHPDSTGGIYYSMKTKNGWSEPMKTGNEVNVHWEAYPSISNKNNLFFQSHREGGYGSIDLYRAEWIAGKFTNVRNLGPDVNSEFGEYNASIAPDESYIILGSSRPAESDEKQLYISFQIGDNLWTNAKSLGPKVNTGGAGGPTFSTDGEYLFFRKNNGIHWISTEFIEEIKQEVIETN